MPKTAIFSSVDGGGLAAQYGLLVILLIYAWTALLLLVEILGVQKDVPSAWIFRLPTWLPTPKDVATATIEKHGMFNSATLKK